MVILIASNIHTKPHIYKVMALEKRSGKTNVWQINLLGTMSGTREKRQGITQSYGFIIWAVREKFHGK